MRFTKEQIACFVLLCVFTLLSFISISCEHDGTSRKQVQLSKKDGESCLIERKCKITVRRWEGSFEAAGNVYYRCWVSNEFYNSVGTEEKVVIDISKCEKVSP